MTDLRMNPGHFVLMVLAVLLTACGGGGTEFEARDNTEEVLAYYASKPDFFSFKTLEDIPADLVWEDGMDLPDLGSPEARKGGTQTYAMQDFPRTFRLVGPDSNGSFRGWLLDNVAMSLAHEHPDLPNQYFPGLAREWAVDEENKTVYLRLDPDARWSNGEPITADDYLFMFFFYQSDYIIAPFYNNWYTNQYTNITKYDEHTISISMPERKPDMITHAIGLSPVPRHFYRELGDDFVERYQWRFVPTTGAYVVRDEDVARGRSVTLTRNENWWAKDKKYFRNLFNVDRIHITVIRDSNNVFEAFRRGDIDQFSLDLAEFWYEKLPDNDPDVRNGYIHKITFYNQKPRPNWGLWINTSRPLLNDKDIRTGINYASNWDLVIESFFRGDYARMNTARDGFDEFSHPTLRARPYDIDKALEHFAKAGFTRRGPDGILVNEQGQRLAFTLTTGYERFRDVMTILREEAAKAGVELRIEVLDSTAAFLKVQEKQHDISFMAFNVGVEMYPRFWDYYHSDNAYDQAFLEDGSINPARQLKVQTNNLEVMAELEFDRMIERYRDSDDKDEMIQLAHGMAEFHHDYASFVPAFVQDYFRLGHWRWVRFPEGFNHMRADASGSVVDLFVHWIDEDMKRETLDARRSGRAFEPEIRVYDQFREQ